MTNKRKFIFDVDGTLTESRKQISTSFQAEFIIFCCKFPTYLVTGSDHDKTVEQLGRDILTRCAGVFNCSGSDVYQQDKFGTADAPYKNIYKSKWKPSNKLINFLSDELDYSVFPNKTGNHIEHRPGGINFSILGRGEGSMEYRKEYVKWDTERLEREDIVDRIKTEFPDLNIQIGGQTGLDISDSDKSQILKYFDHDDKLHFFGDMMEEGQNDYPLAKAVQDMGGKTYHVKDIDETRTWVNRFSSLYANGLRHN
tara:strand:- start:171 stop:935 length:765 start_codon:yes stop_codon:yes gene_type:complete